MRVSEQEFKQRPVVDDIFKLQFSSDAELEIYRDSAIEYQHTRSMSVQEKVKLEM